MNYSIEMSVKCNFFGTANEEFVLNGNQRVYTEFDGHATIKIEPELEIDQHCEQKMMEDDAAMYEYMMPAPMADVEPDNVMAGTGMLYNELVRV